MKKIARHFLIILILLNSFSSLQAANKESDFYWKEAQKQKLWQDAYWLRLLHVTNFWLSSSNESQTESGKFFLSEKQTPKEELKTNIFAIFKPVKNPNAHFQCRFIARFNWIKTKLKIPVKFIPATNCPAFKRWANPGSIIGLEILLSSAQTGTPATLFGHPLLRIRHKWLNDLPGLSQLDDTISFAAKVTDPVLNPVKGIFGLYEGKYFLNDLTSFKKMYGTLESRDLWSYQLKTTEEERLRFIWHLWELLVNKARFDYYYFDENCALRLAELLEITYSEQEFISAYDFSYIPQRLFKRISRAGLIKKINYLPGLGTKIEQDYQSLSQKEKRSFDLLKNQKDKSKFIEIIYKLAPNSKIRILDLLIQWQTYQIKIEEKKSEQRLLDYYLLERSQLSLNEETTDSNIKKIYPPDPANLPAPSSFSLGANFKTGGFINYTYYDHEFITSSSAAYLPQLKIKLLSFDIQLQKLNKVTLFEYSALPDPAPTEQIISKPGLYFLLDYQNSANSFKNKGWNTELGVNWNLFKDQNTKRIYFRTSAFAEQKENSGLKFRLGTIWFPAANFGLELNFDHQENIWSDKKNNQDFSLNYDQKITDSYSILTEIRSAGEHRLSFKFFW